MKPQRAKRPHGQLRRSQVVTTYGPGAMLDLPRRSVMIAALDFWRDDGPEVIEPRLLSSVQAIPGLENVRLRQPSVDSGDFYAPSGGLQSWVFPEWFVTQEVLLEDKQRGIRSRRLLHRTQLIENQPLYLDRDAQKRRPVVPIRFVRACRRGHIGDIEWRGFVHLNGEDCRQDLWLDEEGTTGDLSAITIRCACGQSRRLLDASDFKSRALGTCNGTRPWIGHDSKEACVEANRLLIRTASNAYFAQTLTVISIPVHQNPDLQAALNGIWERFEDTTTAETIANELERVAVQRVLGLFDKDEVIEAVLERHGSKPKSDRKSKDIEFETLSSPGRDLGSSRPGSDFHARNLPAETWACFEMKHVDRVVLVHRLREVTAQVSFTRFESAATDIHGELDAGVQRAALMRHADWVPAVEQRGEGIFLAFSSKAIDEWLKRPAVRARGEQLSVGFSHWKNDHPHSGRAWAGTPYVMLHSLSHLLLTTIALSCGYPASAIRERVYAGASGYGILLYTGTPDSEGTLGGLVDAGKRIKEYFRDALRSAALCSNDPVCAGHDCSNQHDQRFLQGAACHGCLLIAEPSCEMRNDFLDRALVVPTVSTPDAAFFG